VLLPRFIAQLDLRIDFLLPLEERQEPLHPASLSKMALTMPSLQYQSVLATR
jgi:hypothetical protein